MVATVISGDQVHNQKDTRQCSRHPTGHGYHLESKVLNQLRSYSYIEFDYLLVTA